MNHVFEPLLGGMMIGLSSSLMLYFLGRITGISGIFAKILEFKLDQDHWPHFFIGGLVAGGILLKILAPWLMSFEISTSFPRLIIAGLLVGFGTRLGSGCTSGHGVCGLARISSRSFVATITFISFGILTVTFMRFL